MGGARSLFLSRGGGFRRVVFEKQWPGRWIDKNISLEALRGRWIHKNNGLEASRRRCIDKNNQLEDAWAAPQVCFCAGPTDLECRFFGKQSPGRWIDKNSSLEALRRRWIDKNSGLKAPRRRWIDKNTGLEGAGRATTPKSPHSGCRRATPKSLLFY